MAADRLVSVLGLGFGDCGKGLVVDALVRRLGARTVVRFNGGAQAGHNVVLDDGRHHTFSQFGAGTFSAGVDTVLAHPVVVHPTALLEEARALAQVGVDDSLSRLLVDPRCRVTTPFHQAAGRLREWQRGAAAHGSCGAGFGETVAHALAHPDQALRWDDLAVPERARDKLAAIRAGLLGALAPWRGEAETSSAEAAHEWDMLDADDVAERWLTRARQAHALTPRASLDRVLHRLAAPGVLVFEGAQGALLDETHGFHPHTTWSATGASAVESVVAEAAMPADVRHLGVARTYLTRHGAGPMPTEDGALDALAEPHNRGDGWQGAFRRGHADALLLRHAVRTAGPLAGLVVTHMDALHRATPMRWCTSYRVPADAIDRSACAIDPACADRVVALRAGAAGAGTSPRPGEGAAVDPMTRLLQAAVPEYDPRPTTSDAMCVARFASVAEVPVVATSSGPTAASLAWRTGRT